MVGNIGVIYMGIVMGKLRKFYDKQHSVADPEIADGRVNI